MNYHVHSEGRDLGRFPLEELRRRREVGELSGTEFVWCEGMTDWASLDSVLSSGTSSTPQMASDAPVAEQPKKKSNRSWLWAAAGGVVVLGLMVAGVAGIRFVRRVQEFRREAVSEEGLAAASKQVSAGAKSATEADARKRSRQFRIRQWLEAYEAVDGHSPHWDALATNMITAWIENNFGTPTTNGPSVAEMCDLLAGSAGCNDPLVLTVTGLNATEVHEKVERLERAMAGFKSAGYKAYPRLNALASLLAEAGEDQERYRTLYRAAMQALEQCFRDGSFRSEDQAELGEIFVVGWGDALLKRSREGFHPFSRQAGASFEWLSAVLEGEFQIDQAWRSRGSGYANTVSEEGWKGFALHLAIARTNLTHAWKLRPDLPLAPCRLMSVALGESDATEMRKWFDRTLAAQIDYPKAWSEMRWGLRPRWHGSLDAMLALGKLAIDTKRFDTDVPRKFFDVVSDLESEIGVPHGQHIYGRDDIWPSLQQMYEGYIAEPSQEASRPGWRSTYAVVASLAGQYDTAKTQMEAVEWQPWPRQLSGWGADLSLLPLEIAARTGKLASRVADAETSYQHEEVENAWRRYQELKDAPDADERTRKFIGHRLATLELEKKLQHGDWVDLLPQQENDPAWVIAYGKIHRLNDGAVEVESDKFGHMLYCRARVGTNFEAQGEFEIVKSSTGAFQAGVVAGLPNMNDSDWYGFLMKNNEVEKQVVSFTHAWSPRRIARPAALNEKRNSFRLRFQNGKVTAWINSQEMIPPTETTRAMRIQPRNFLAGLGAYNDMNNTVLRYEKVQIRRLTVN